MEKLSFKQKLRTLLYTFKYMRSNVKMYISHAYELAERQSRVETNWSNFSNNYEVNTAGGEELEEGDIYLPEHSVATVEGDGYKMLIENPSRFNKTFYWSVKRENQVDYSNDAPPLFDEEEEYE